MTVVNKREVELSQVAWEFIGRSAAEDGITVSEALNRIVLWAIEEEEWAAAQDARVEVMGRD